MDISIWQSNQKQMKGLISVTFEKGRLNDCTCFLIIRQLIEIIPILEPVIDANNLSICDGDGH